MSIKKILSSLEKAWEREDILLKIQNGVDTDKIVNEFLANNDLQITKLKTLLRPKDIVLLNQVEELSTCESKLINKIKDLNNLENNKIHYSINKKKNLPSSRGSNRISLFMINWSNKALVIALLIISAIALSKQAWA